LIESLTPHDVNNLLNRAAIYSLIPSVTPLSLDQIILDHGKLQ